MDAKASDAGCPQDWRRPDLLDIVLWFGFRVLVVVFVLPFQALHERLHA